MVTPSSRFSNTMETGIRVPRNTHAPLTFPGTLSTAGHWDQSSSAIFVLLFRVKGNRHLVTNCAGGDPARFADFKIPLNAKPRALPYPTVQFRHPREKLRFAGPSRY